MKKLVIVLIFLSSIVYSQKNYFPLEVGNYWQYKVTYTPFSDTSYFYKSSEVLKDTIIANQNNTYYQIKIAFFWKPLSSDSIKYIRYDSLHNSIVEYDPVAETESMLYKLDAVENECWDYFGVEVCCFLIDSSLVFDKMKPSKVFGIRGGPPFWECTLAKDFGPIKLLDDQSWGFPAYSVYDLVYAKIGGVEYGQLVNVTDQHLELLNKFYLSQNYPNPFNPNTKIEYSISKTSFVKLIIYDILGREDATLVNEEKPAGNYEVEFSASGRFTNGGDGKELTSGVYFYKLQTGNYSSVKKMILMK